MPAIVLVFLKPIYTMDNISNNRYKQNQLLTNDVIERNLYEAIRLSQSGNRYSYFFENVKIFFKSFILARENPWLLSLGMKGLPINLKQYL